MKSKNKILSVIILSIMIVVIIMLSLKLDREKSFTINKIDISGNYHQTVEQYFQFAHLQQCIDEDLPIMFIKDRLIKHPYVQNADVVFSEKGSVKVLLTEKNISAILIDKRIQYFLTDDLEVLPILPNTTNADFPLISHLRTSAKIKEMIKIHKEKSAINALKIMKTLEMTNTKLFQNLSEIDMNKGRDISLYFSNISYPVIIGRQKEVRRVIYFSKLWEHLSGKKLNTLMKYVDLRFNDLVYFGFREKISES